MATKTSTNETAGAEAKADAVVDVTAGEAGGSALRHPRSPFDLFPSVFPSSFADRWPDFFGHFGGFGPMKVEEQVDDGQYVIRAEVPGVDPDEGIDINVEDGVLTISAVRQKRTEADEANDFRSEFHYGSFRRSMTLPRGAEADDIKATYRDGILEVHVPVATDEPSGKKIPVERPD